MRYTGATFGYSSWRFENTCGYRLVVGRVLAKDEVGVRFSLPAQIGYEEGLGIKVEQLSLRNGSKSLSKRQTGDNSGDCGDKRQEPRPIYVF